MHQKDKPLKQAIPKKDEKLSLKIQQRLKVFLLVRIIKHQKPKLSYHNDTTEKEKKVVKRDKIFVLLQ